MKLELTDRERILLHIIEQFASTQLLAPKARGYNPEDFGEFAHLAYYRKPEAGDLVFASTGNLGRWKIGWYVSARDDGAVIREIGTDVECDYGNESFIPIVNLRPSCLVEGGDRILQAKVQQAFAREREYLYRFRGVEFDGDECVIWIGEVFGGAINDGSEPFHVRIPRNPKQSIKAIIAALRAGGYGTRKFEHKQDERVT